MRNLLATALLMAAPLRHVICVKDGVVSDTQENAFLTKKSEVALPQVYSFESNHLRRMQDENESQPTIAMLDSPSDRNLLVPTRAELVVRSSRDDYRETQNGRMTKGPETSRLFKSKNWNKLAFRFTFPDRKRTVPKEYEYFAASLEVFPVESSDSSLLSNPIHGYAVGHATGYPRGFQRADFHITDAPKTAAVAKIDPGPFYKNEYNQLVSVTDIVKEILARDDYVEGNPIEIFLMGEESEDLYREVYAFSGTYGATRAAKLYVYYTVPQAVFAPNAGGPYQVVNGCEFEVDASKTTFSFRSGPPVNYTWDFGDGTIKTSKGPTSKHRYERWGEFDIKLTVYAEYDQKTDTTVASTSGVLPGFHTTNRVISHFGDDYAETASGKMNAKATKHGMWSKKHKFQAYRFVDTFIEPGADILWADLEMFVSGRVGNNISGLVFAEKVGDAPAFEPGEDYQLSKARKTHARATIFDPPRWKYREYNVVADVTSVIQEIVDRDDFALGNAIKLILVNNHSPGVRKVGAYGSGHPARLSVHYRFDSCARR